MSAGPKVAVVMGSDSDLPVVEGTVELLEQFGVPFEVRVLSAHRSPDALEQFAAGAEERGLQVVIAAAGGAAHLAGVLAARTALPVIGVPVPTDRMGGLDSLLSTVQMPAGVPVACMGLGTSGARNAAVMAVEILAVHDADLRESLRRHREQMADRVREQDELVQRWLEERRGAEGGVFG
ncbi:MAG: 5-(carboxyamino)imidazole ribonucleotide mutase [Planctomycetota bacterium]|jgi:phosphoribosylaminoimidazole carboxylase PurE protein